MKNEPGYGCSHSWPFHAGIFRTRLGQPEVGRRQLRHGEERPVEAPNHGGRCVGVGEGPKVGGRCIRGDQGPVCEGQIELRLGGDRATVVYRPVDLSGRDALRTNRRQPDIAINDAATGGGGRGGGQNREVGARSQVNWSRTCRQRPVRDHKGQRKGKADEDRFRFADYSCQGGADDKKGVTHEAILANRASLLYGVKP